MATYEPSVNLKFKKRKEKGPNMRKIIIFILQLNFLIISRNLYLNNNFFHSLVIFFGTIKL